MRITSSTFEVSGICLIFGLKRCYDERFNYIKRTEVLQVGAEFSCVSRKFQEINLQVCTTLDFCKFNVVEKFCGIYRLKHWKSTLFPF